MKVTHVISISAPPQIVWTYLENPDKMKLWMAGMVDSVRTNPGELAKGATFRMRVREGSRVAVYDGEVVELERPSMMRISLRGGSFGSMPMIVDYRLCASDRGVRLEFEQCVQLTGMYRVMTPLFNFFGRIQIRRFMQTLKSLAEAESR